MATETSEWRRAVCAAVCSRVLAAAPGDPRKLALSDHLEVLPFERMTDAALADLAVEMGVPAAQLERISAAHTSERYQTELDWNDTRADLL